jgi:hypothetical protein
MALEVLNEEGKAVGGDVTAPPSTEDVVQPQPTPTPEPEPTLEPEPVAEPAPSGEEDDTKVPFHKHPRFQELIQGNKTLKESLEAERRAREEERRSREELAKRLETLESSKAKPEEKGHAQKEAERLYSFFGAEWWEANKDTVWPRLLAEEREQKREAEIEALRKELKGELTGIKTDYSTREALAKARDFCTKNPFYGIGGQVEVDDRGMSTNLLMRLLATEVHGKPEGEYQEIAKTLESRFRTEVFFPMLKHLVSTRDDQTLKELEAVALGFAKKKEDVKSALPNLSGGKSPPNAPKPPPIPNDDPDLMKETRRLAGIPEG